MKLCNIQECTGCLSCVNACRNNAIELTSDSYGFYYPLINSDNCIECGLCAKSCPSLNAVEKHNPIKVYSGWSVNEDVRMNSSSGGAFTEIARFALAKGGVVFGCMLNDKFKAVHGYIENDADLEKLQRSKYVQSYIGSSYKRAKEFLDSGRVVLFSGTPCQIAGLLMFLHKDYPNLYTVDLICHGVPSPAMWEDYKTFIEKENDFVIDKIRFREKSVSWIYFRMKIEGKKANQEKGSYEGSYYRDRWLQVFLSDYFLRDSCYDCKFCSVKRCSDFTIADWWGYKGKGKIDKGFKQKGVSLIFVNTKKATALDLNETMYLNERTLEEAIRTNKSLKMPWVKPINFDVCRHMYPRMSFQEISDVLLHEQHLTFEKLVLDRVRDSDIISFLLKFTRIKSKLKRMFSLL